MLYAVLPSHYAAIGLLPYQVGLILSANRIVRLFTNHLAERFCRKYSMSLLLTVSLTVGALITAAYALFTSFGILLLARVVWGLCWSFIRQIGFMTVVEASSQGHLAQLMGFYSGISRQGSVFGNLVGAIGHDVFGFAVILLIFAAFSLLAVPLGPLSRRDLPGASQVAGEQLARPAANAGWALLICGFAVGCVGGGILASTLGFLLKEEVGASAQVAGIHIGVATLTGALLASRWVADLMAPLLGGVADRVGPRVGAIAFFALGGATLLGAALLPGALWLVVMVLLFYLCATGVSVVLSAQAGSRGALAVASYVTASDLGSAVGPNLGWWAPQFDLPIASVLVLASALYLAASLVVAVSFRERPTSRDAESACRAEVGRLD